MAVRECPKCKVASEHELISFDEHCDDDYDVLQCRGCGHKFFRCEAAKKKDTYCQAVKPIPGLPNPTPPGSPQSSEEVFNLDQ